MSVRIIHGDCRDVLPTLPADSFDCCVTSPSYYGLRDYGVAGQIGLEPTMQEYLETMVSVCREIMRALKPQGTFWLNIGSCYANGGIGGGGSSKSTLGGASNRNRQGVGRRTNAASDGMNSSPFLPQTSALACGSGGKEPSGLISPDLSCLGRDGEYQDASSLRSAHTRRPLPGSPGRDGMTVQDSALLDSELLDELSRLSPKALSFFGYDPGDFYLADAASASPRQPPKYSCDEPQKKGRVSDRKKTSGQSSSRTLGMGASERACNCNSCGLCFVYLSTMALKFKPKDLLLVPDLLALALQADGWYVRSEIIWAKPNPMPESVRDRPTCAHEKVWLLTKSARYFYDADAIAEESCGVPELPRRHGNSETVQGKGGGYRVGSTNGKRNARNARNVWSIASQPYSGAHFATMPPALAERCIKAGCPQGGTVIDPFGGAGTTGLVADRLGRHATLIELNPEYRSLAGDRVTGDAPLFAEVSA